MTAGLARRVFVFARIVLVASLVATLVWAVLTITKRPLDGVEGDVLFEADRIRSGLPLYVDPMVGALEYGAPPARYLVLYPPLWSAFLALVPRSIAIVAGRALAFLAWFGAIGLIVARCPKPRRTAVATAGAFVAGIWVLALYGASARPDAAAIFFSAFAIERVTRRIATRRETSTAARFDALAGVAFALAAWIKPNVVGAAPGVLFGCLVVARGSARDKLVSVLPGVGALVATSVGIAATLQVVSHGAWLEHLLASTGQPPSLSLWFEQLSARGPFFLGPLAVALFLGLRARREPAAFVATSALATSLGWALVSLAKTGSATNYFLEPSVTMLVVVSYLPRSALPDLGGKGPLVWAVLALVQVVWNGTASIGSAVRAIPIAFDRASILADVRTHCGARKTDVVIADEPGIELALDGRIVMTPFQTTHRVRRGRYSEELWLRDISAPAVTCLVMQDDLLERPLADERVAHDRFTPEMRRALQARFELAQKQSGYFVYRLRSERHDDAR